MSADSPAAVAHDPALGGERYSVRVEVFEGGSEPTVVGAAWHREPLTTAEAVDLLGARVAPVIERAAARADDEAERSALERAAALVRASVGAGRALLLDNPPHRRRAPREGFVLRVELGAPGPA